MISKGLGVRCHGAKMIHESLAVSRPIAWEVWLQTGGHSR